MEQRNVFSGRLLPWLVGTLIVALILSSIALTYVAVERTTSVNNKINANTAGIAKLTAGQCASTGQFYDLINRLLLDTSPSFDGGPKNRILYINKILESERKTIPHLHKQGCTLKITIPANLPHL